MSTRPAAFVVPRGAGTAPQVGPDPGQQLGQAKRFGEVVVGAGLQADDHVDLLVPRGQHHQHAPRLSRAQAPADLDAVHIGQTEIQQCQIEDSSPSRGQRVAAGSGQHHGMPVGAQAGGQDVPDGGVVLHHQQFGHVPTINHLKER